MCCLSAKKSLKKAAFFWLLLLTHHGAPRLPRSDYITVACSGSKQVVDLSSARMDRSKSHHSEDPYQRIQTTTTTQLLKHSRTRANHRCSRMGNILQHLIARVGPLAWKPIGHNRQFSESRVGHPLSLTREETLHN